MKKEAKNTVLLFCLIFVFASCGDSWKKYISLEIDKEIGNQAQNQCDLIYKNQILPEAENKELYHKINLIKERILKSGKVAHADEFDWELKIINDSILNAFCLPGGKIYLFTGIIKYLDNEAQLAGVMGHEIAHADKRHAVDNLVKQLGLSSVINLIFGDAGSVIDIAQNLVDLKFSRDNEAQADEYAVNYLYETVYDASEANGFFDKLEKENQDNEIESFLSTHPAPENRKEKMMEHWRKLGGKKGEKMESNFLKIKQLLPEKSDIKW